jgi:diketogulonate reductase-like aldo/keto reductase
MILNETYTLSNGVEIPKLGLGTWRIDNDEVAQVVRGAAQIGYRHFDTAQAYSNENGLGAGIKSSGVPREELFITSKVAAEHKTYAAAKASIDASLATSGLNHIDLMLIHSPQPWAEFRRVEHFFEGNLEAWRALEDAYNAGKLRAIGVSNFEKVDLDNLIDNGSVKPMVNQILAHIGNTPFDLIDYSRSKDILVEAYSPVAHGKILDNDSFKNVAETYGVSVAQLCIRYCLQLGILPLPKTATPQHMRNNAELDFEIDAVDMEALKAAAPVKDYGDAATFPVFGVPRNSPPADTTDRIHSDGQHRLS